MLMTIAKVLFFWFLLAVPVAMFVGKSIRLMGEDTPRKDD